MHWYLVVPSTDSSGGTWLDHFAPTDTHHVLHHVAPPALTVSTRTHTNLAQWREYVQHGREGWRLAGQHRPRGGVITCFPQPTLATGMSKRFSTRRDVPLLAWNFNLGRLPGRTSTRASRLAWESVDCFVVHSRHEARTYARWFDLPLDRFEYVPVAAPTRQATTTPAGAPYLVAMGAARRDYATLVKALATLRVPSTIVAPPHAVQGLTMPDHVTLRSGLSRTECFDLLAAARVHVLPLEDIETASGQVTIAEAMRFGTPTIATRSPGLLDYGDDGEELLFVDQGDPDAMRAAIARLWDDEPLRAHLRQRARARAMREFSDEAVAARLYQILDRLAPATRR